MPRPDPQKFWPAPVALTITGGVPVVITTNAQPAAAALTITGGVPEVVAPVRPPAATLTITGYAPSVGTTSSVLLAKCDQIWSLTRQLERVDDAIRKQQPLIRLWNAEWELQFILGNEYKASFSFISNDTGPGQIEIPFDTPVARWIHDHQGRIDRGEGRQVCVTSDYCGARWSGVMDKYSIEQREDGDRVLVVDFLHDYEHL